ncbi:hypothetical protein OF83DRAFT_344596 [Amylostereum chailletii]|nr:hypothetical protein OF83DRAFT_344596 [Amylostereum chailletii]
MNTTANTTTARPADILGPNVIAMFFEALETGFIIAQSIRFWERSVREPPWLLGTVAFVTVVALFQTAAGMADFWRVYVANYGDFAEVLTFGWPQLAQSTVTMLMAAPVQVFLIWRCWTVPLVLLLAASVVSSIIVTAQCFTINFVGLFPTDGQTPSSMGAALSTPFILSLVMPAVLDIALTTILLTFLLRSRSNVYTKRFRRILLRLIIIVWEVAVPPSACAITALVTYIVLSNKNFWDLAFQAILGKLYVISLLVTLNARFDIAMSETNTHFPTLTGSLGLGGLGGSRRRGGPQFLQNSETTGPTTHFRVSVRWPCSLWLVRS